MNNLQLQNYIPFVYIVDSPSSEDLLDGYSIGMAFRDTLIAVHIPVIYTLASNKITFELALRDRLAKCIAHNQTTRFSNAYPFIHLCMHGNENKEEIVLTDETPITWIELRRMLLSHNEIKGYDPLVCMASCYGFHAQSMANHNDSVFNYLVGHTGAVGQSDLTVAYLAFYNHIFWKNPNDIERAVEAMQAASGDKNFYCINGKALQRYKSLKFLKPIRITTSGNRIAQDFNFETM